MKRNWQVKLHRPVAGLFFCLLLFVFSGPSGRAQVTQGSIVGTVKDTKGAVVSGATVTLTNADTNVVRTTQTSNSGEYDIEDVVAGRYTVDVESSGFQKWEATNVTLQVRQHLRVDADLVVGAVSEQVTVSGTTLPAIETESPTISGTYSADMALSLPVNTRASFSGTSAYNIINTLPGFQNGALQGSLPFMTDIAVDGTTLHFSDQNNGFPSSESISEIRADGVLANAEYGDPGQVVVTTKSGTNRLHGSAFWYYQSSAFDAIPYTYPITTQKPNQIGNTFGASAGGPVVIPHFYNGHDKSFFYGAYEGWRHPATSTSFAVVPSTLMKQGDFSKYSSPDFPTGSTLVNPNTGANMGVHIPTAAINPISASFLKTFYPDPNIGDPSAYTDDGTNNWQKNVDNSANSNQFDVRGDQYFGANQKFLLWGRYTWKNNSSNSFGGWLLPNKTALNQNRVLKIDTNWTITPGLINEGSFSFARNISTSNTPFDGQAWTQQQGFVGLQDLWFQGLPENDFYRISSMGGRLNSPGKGFTYIYADTLLWNLGRHTMKFGGQFETFESYSTLGFFGADNYGTFGFNTTRSQGLVNPIDFADFLLGVPYKTNYDDVQKDNDGITSHFYAFAQDEWRISDRLTLSYGVRYELQPGYHDKGGDIGNIDTGAEPNGRIIYMKGWDKLLNQAYLASANACNPDGIHNTNSATINGAACMPVQNNEQAGLPIGLREHPKLRFEPRFGFAWRPFGDDKWAVRGGFGIYNATMGSSSFYSLTGTIQTGTVEYDNTYTGPGSLKFQWPQIFNGAGKGGCFDCYGQDYFGTANLVKWKDPYTEQWALSIDHDFGSGYGARVSYIGSETHQLIWAPDENTLPYSDKVSAYNQPLSARRFPNWGRIEDRATGADASYHSLQIEGRHRMQNGLEYNSTFTYAKSLADNEGAAPGSGFAGETGGNRSTTPLSARVDFGNVGQSPRYYWNTTALYDLPFGRGKHFASGINRATDLLIGGWRLTGIFTWHSGDWLTPYIPGNQADPSGTGSGLNTSLSGFVMPARSQYPDRLPGISVKPHDRNRLTWLNAAAFTCPGDPTWVPGLACHTGAGFNADGTPRYTGPGANHPLPIARFGNSQVGSVAGPGFVNLNAGLSKSFTIVEGIRMKVEGTFTNVLNHTNLGDPNMDITASTFGRITSSGSARTGQVDARIEF